MSGKFEKMKFIILLNEILSNRIFFFVSGKHEILLNFGNQIRNRRPSIGCTEIHIVLTGSNNQFQNNNFNWLNQSDCSCRPVFLTKDLTLHTSYIKIFLVFCQNANFRKKSINFPISFKPKVAIVKFIWKIQKKKNGKKK